MLEAIMLGVVITRDDATTTYNYRSQRNYTRVELAAKHCTLDLPTRWRMKARRRDTT